MMTSSRAGPIGDAVVHPLCWLVVGARVVSNLSEAHGPQPCDGGFGQENLGDFRSYVNWMVMNRQRTPRLKPLPDRVPQGFMVDTPWLRGQRIDPKSIHDYVARGWLKRVIRGVYRRPLPEGAQGADETSCEIPLLSLQWIMKYAVHLGGESALNMAGASPHSSNESGQPPYPPFMRIFPSPQTTLLAWRTG